MSAREFILPDLGEGLTEAEVVAWLVQPGDEVSVDQPVVELESAKSVVQLPTPFAGVVESLGGEVGQVLHAGAVLMRLTPVGAGAESDTAVEETADGAAAQQPVPAEPGVAVPTEAATEESGAVLIGYGTRPSAATARSASAPSRFGSRRPTGPSSDESTPSPAPAAVPADSTSEPGSDADDPRAALDHDRHSPVVSPIVRRLAREHGFDATELLGSGPDGLVTRGDVEAFIQELEAARAGTHTGVTAAHAGAAPSVAPTPSPTPVPTGAGDHRVPLDRTARAAAAHFTRSRREIPEATVWMDVDATELLTARRQLQDATGERFGMTALVARFVVAGLKRHPSLNASFDADRNELVLHSAINLGLAAQTPRGLLVPVVHGAERMSLRELRDAVQARTEQATTGAFPPDALTKGTFTLNNYGTLGVDGSAAIINHPEAAMLGIGRLVERPWVVDGQLAVRTVTELTISFDHRVCDGAEAAAFLTYVARCIERPISLLADL
ncbi:pyruvate dehydrogenase E2 component (dihydrolipoamide acetyltransferase) [Agromyces flavus]|uniref:Dihydrolipoamide acetyltransferase component of pyruvate dehydrogenase complex n=1 Tax=Agromyces flavus TaxID=589382 RepID=A0A1H1R9T5_9MICO|nr:dihydrolipoamide acetyltransferase family protein [Agromyces flavus]MCP2367591.1 pyruvate dehydrogenase E2 component (dihydrolipoamide acetyltransferase) [Agromyces flavus]GGI47003.1 dihydrolipoamide acetyltransferase component of pyruvate dehydrogenase complex [Agromyces flavus]SDS32522.1 pyruvate dehydrogenase E2 component (dihydrolipoamide acetyltransferase) [Agromyces flavus]